MSERSLPRTICAMGRALGREARAGEAPNWASLNPIWPRILEAERASHGHCHIVEETIARPRVPPVPRQIAVRRNNGCDITLSIVLMCGGSRGAPVRIH